MAARTQRESGTPASETINLRASAEQKALIDNAAARLGKSRTEFMLDSAREAAENVLLDQRLILMDETAHDRFTACLDEPVEPADTLRDLLATRPPWER